MRKNKMMRLASMLLVLCLLTTSVISGTFAKYTTQDSANDTARVAKWGVELQVVGNLFGESYGNDDKIVLDTDNDITVQAKEKANNATAAAGDIVAPGTKNENGFTFSLKGQPEVDGEVTTTMIIQEIFLAANTYGVMIPVDNTVATVTEATFDEFVDAQGVGILYYKDGDTFKLATNFTDGANGGFYTLEDKVVVDDTYYPVVYALDGNTTIPASNDNSPSLQAAANAIANSLGITKKTLTASDAEYNKAITVYTGTKSFATNTDLASWKVDGLTLTWAWAFDKGAAGDNAANTKDGADTILGMLENLTEGTVVKASGNNFIAPVEYTDYCLDTQFSIDITVSQVD